MSRHAKTTGGTISSLASAMLDVCAVRFPNGAVGAFKLVLDDGIAKLLVEDGAALHGIGEMPVDPALSTTGMAMGLLLDAAEASAQRTNHYGLLMRCALLREGLIDVDAFQKLAAWIAMRGVVQRAMDGTGRR